MSKRNRGKKYNAKSPKRAIETSQDAWRYGDAMLTPAEVEARRREAERMRRWAKEAVKP